MSVDTMRAHGEPVAVVVEVGSQIRRHVEDYFQRNDIRMIAWDDGLDADRIIHASRANMILLNLNLHESKAFSLCQQIKEKSRIPVVMVSSTYTEVEKIVSLEMGADDCLPIDFNPRQVVARMRSVLGMQRASVTVGDQLTGRGVTLNRATRQAQVGRDRIVDLTPTEFEFLNFLVVNAGSILTREQIHAGVFGISSAYTVQFVDVMIYRLRKKIEQNHRKPKFLRTLRNLGYILKVDA
jgi:DNA-binding response OmpR family regulator